jgi:hypothetical protein
VCIKYFFKLEKKCYGTIEMLSVDFREQTMERTQFLSGFPKPKAMSHLLKMTNAKDIHQQAKQMKMWIR